MKHRLSQEELAYKLKIAQTSVSNIEANKSIPDFLLMQRVCEVFDVNIDYFLENKQVNKAKINTGGVVGCNNGTINNFPKNIIGSILKRIELLEKKNT